MKEELLREKKNQLESLLTHAIPGNIVEFGCGTGFVLNVLSHTVTNSTIVGVDMCMNRLKRVSPVNVMRVRADITQTIFHKKTFDTALFVSTLHEVFSLGKGKVEDALAMSHIVLKDDGVLLIQDSCKPAPQQVEITFTQKEPRERFSKFVKEFRPRNVKFKQTATRVTLDIVDALDFVSKYRCASDVWDEEMGETHFFFTEKEYCKTAQKVGFTVKDSKILPTYARYDIIGMEYEFEYDYSQIQLVLVKD